ncbi:hypothetical protein GGI20_000741 [Coemansia sp. BCRC 34301]|nr:hypothetical protein GGI20_000741 [Coemansia sp. BCRC 34301]
MVGNFTGQVELQKAKDELDNCTFVSPSTKGCYSSRIALWIHYCNQCCNGDDAVTGSRLGDYVEWMVDSGAAERIRQDQTHIQQVLRNQLQGVICYWRIQNNDRADVPDPRKSHVFMSKWHGIVQRFPRERQSRRSEPIYGTQLPGTDSNPVAMPRSRPSPPPPTSLMNKWRPAISGPSGGAGSRPLPPISHHQHSLQRHRYPSTFNGATVNGTNPPAAFHSSAASDGGQAQASNEHMYRSPQVATRAPIAPQARMGGPNSHPLASSKFIIPQVPSLQLASHAASANNAAMSRVSSASLEYEDEAKAENDERASSYQRAPGRPSVHVPQQVPKHEAPLSTLNKSLRGEFPSEMPVWDASAVKAPEGYLLVKEEVAALNLRQLEINNYQQAQARAYYNLGIASWLSVEQRSALTLADVFMDETSTLAIQEQQLLLPLVQVASSPPAMQREGLVPHAADGSEEKPIPSTAPASPARDTTDMIVRKAESLPPVNSAPLVQGSLEREAPPAAEQSTGGLVLAATVSPARAISIAIRSPSGMHSGMTQVLRHSNPLLCTWSALAIMFFQKWHLAKEPTPDFASPQWLSGKLFTSANGANAAMVAEDFEMAFKVACKDISSDR